MSKRGPRRRPVFETWATINKDRRLKPDVCLWGDQQQATEGCEYDEYVCLVRVEVLEVLDEQE